MISDKDILRVHSVTSFDKYDTMQEAIDGGRCKLNAENSRLASQLHGAIVKSVQWSDCGALFRFANGMAIHVYANPDGVRWSAGGSVYIEMPELEYPRTLVIQHSKKSDSVLWQRAHILESRVGYPFGRIMRSGRNAFLYTEGCPVLLFCVLCLDNFEEEGWLLSWNDSE